MHCYFRLDEYIVIVGGVLIVIDPGGSPINSISVSQRHPDQLLVTEEHGCIRCWNLSTKTCQFQYVLNGDVFIFIIILLLFYDSSFFIPTYND